MPQPRKPTPIDPAQVRRHLSTVALVMNDHYLRYLLQLYAAFDGDIVAAIVLGEVAHHNASRIRQGLTSRQLAIRLADPTARDGLVPTNAFSIAQATGIPRETVRRKIAYLVGRGLLARDARANLVFTVEARDAFGDLTEQLVRDLLECADRLRELLDPPSV